MINLFEKYYTIRNIFLILLESLLLYVSILLTWFIVSGGSRWIDYSGLHLKAAFIIIVCVFCLYCNNVYSIKDITGYMDLAIKLFQSLGMALILLALFYIGFSQASLRTGFFFVYVPVVVAVLSTWRFVYVFVLKTGLLNQRILVVGDGDFAVDICREIEREIDSGYSVEVLVTEKHVDGLDTLSTPHHHSYERLAKTAEEFEVERIVVALKEKRGSLPVEELLLCRMNGIDVVDGNTFYEMLTGKFLVSSINPAWLIFSGGFRKGRVRSMLKRLEDIVVSTILLILFSPVMLVAAIFIKLDSRGPLLFAQERLGKGHKPYRLFKLRSMVENAEKESGPVWALKNDTRVTRVGLFIRKWRVDELPQLFNVLKGDMSLVGPRPERAHFVKQLETELPYYAERFTVRPGVTGWAQVRYGYGDSVEDAMEKLNYDLFYIKNMSLFMDIVIIFRTVRTVLFGVGAR
ncbi:TIGR03013 family XrtA/PEP-CTERM system glycosyltransferase [Desulfoluna spongiiphila]|uniref:Sugar transferase, PEP-CTERM system associated/exopolysaccharide biosynthesis polyprenyl glycosylphosphotransferase n=1 Tax=Desulfoluna spongiiphila TaxID=419481 RepID=A0A1G5C2D8_9BACT|nr:TIGR03013 family XrtA/PEP-CTERM system glycosyltransferase [Desulfoluna spongiiphila]SCX96464.1 sugar transferase, PEP-CTERM system associated/exopolysaccharide biosynthesis polyprenyl glycosylphosphotransferase [Desulfoluna spongiiphila]VVS94062.1 exopolysaccharide biosynthesis polyprenyl glycosylphosphotransferase [Desulfoluna spongiiphila]